LADVKAIPFHTFEEKKSLHIELGTQHQGSHKFKIEDAIKDIA